MKGVLRGPRTDRLSLVSAFPGPILRARLWKGPTEETAKARKGENAKGNELLRRKPGSREARREIDAFLVPHRIVRLSRFRAFAFSSDRFALSRSPWRSL